MWASPSLWSPTTSLSACLVMACSPTPRSSTLPHAFSHTNQDLEPPVLWGTRLQVWHLPSAALCSSGGTEGLWMPQYPDHLHLPQLPAGDRMPMEEDLRANGPDGDYHGDRPLSRDHLYLRLDHSYRDSSLSPSPCSSLSSRSWFSDASSCESFSHVYDDVDSELNEAAARFTLGSPLTSPGCASPQTGGGVLEEQPHWQHQHPAFVHHSHSISLSPRQSPCHSPRTSVTDENWLSPRPPSRPSSRPTSPCGKRRHSSADICYPISLSPHHSPTPTPGPSPRGSVTEDTWVGSPSVGMSPFQCCPSEADIPSKTRKTSQDRTTMQSGKGELGLDDQGNMSPNLDSPSDEALHSLKKDGPGEQFLSVPSHFSWNKPKPGHTPIFR